MIRRDPRTGFLLGWPMVAFRVLAGIGMLLPEDA